MGPRNGAVYVCVCTCVHDCLQTISRCSGGDFSCHSVQVRHKVRGATGSHADLLHPLLGLSSLSALPTPYYNIIIVKISCGPALFLAT